MITPMIGDGFRGSASYRALRRGLSGAEKRHRATHLAGSSKAVLVAALAEDLRVPVVVLAATAERAEAWHADLEALLGEGAAGLYPPWEILPYENRPPQREVVGQRLEFLAGLLDGRIAVGVTSVRAAIQRIPSPAALESRLLRLAVGERIELDRLAARLVALGFEREAMVSEVGTFSVRGGIVDVFGFRLDQPVRIELEADRLESIRVFDLATQRSVDVLDRVEILPARERIGGSIGDQELAGIADQGAALGADLELRSLAEHIHPDALVVLDESDRVDTQLEAAWSEIVARHGEAAWDREVPSPEFLYDDAARFHDSLAPFRRLDLYALHLEREAGPPTVRFRTREPEPIQRSTARLAEALRHHLAAGERPIVLCDNLGQLERLEELLPRDVAESISLAVGALEGGFIEGEVGLAVYTDHEIFARRRRVRRRRRYAAGAPVEHLTQIAPGDFLVHLEYGIGRFEGLERLTLAEGGEVEVIKLAYAEGDVLYVPVEQLARIEKYTSEEGKPPTLHRLGSGHWERQKARTTEAIAALAEELLRVHAAREIAEGFAFSEDTAWQREMESAFLYEDTPDQRAAAEAVKRDMERRKPMDRLLCGDVGYGKTEVAIRAAFKAVQDGKQVAVLVPTTVLAVQHLETFRERLADYPVRIEMLSRFNTPAERRSILAAIADGTVDIAIGTHALLSPTVTFADLGLVVIDEEHRFGVRSKERLKSLKSAVDVLALSATPIPRTLQMSLMGLRDMSVIETPPRDRTPIVTWVSEFDDELVEEAIRRELDRGGQVFFVHNRVQTIDAARRLVERMVPEARLGVAHGQMRERDLEAVMLTLFHGEIDVLVTTAIIESGLDVPSANTILVGRADRFGLADLYQLRGRVGRSYHRAFCYLLTPPRDMMTPEAEKRLRVLEEHTELGAGYRIALRDLELRGAGNLLGPEQAGFIAAVGFETYLRLLEETVRSIRGEEETRLPEPELAFDADAYFPDRYVPDGQQKLGLYRRLARLKTPEAIVDFARELADRYGPLPTPARHLLDAARLKALGARAGVARIRVRPREAEAELRWPAGIEPRFAPTHFAPTHFVGAPPPPMDGPEVEVTVRRVAPLHIAFKAQDEATLIAALFEGLQAWGPVPILTLDRAGA
jgi:transcription-repair coupling factor (superfamily II helicase)